MIYVASKTFENGTKEEEEFQVYTDMVQWFAKTPEAGMSAYIGFTEEVVDQIQLQDDVAALIN